MSCSIPRRGWHICWIDCLKKSFFHISMKKRPRKILTLVFSSFYGDLRWKNFKKYPGVQSGNFARLRSQKSEKKSTFFLTKRGKIIISRKKRNIFHSGSSLEAMFQFSGINSENWDQDGIFRLLGQIWINFRALKLQCHY